MIVLPRNSRLLPVFGILAIFLVSGIVYYRAAIPPVGTSLRPQFGASSQSQLSRDGANATLGFGGLFVVSGPGSPRRKHLEEAAAVTELELTIPEQKEWTDVDIYNFRADNKSASKLGSGSIKAWLSHHLVLNAFLDSGLETALIMEDDVDWDIRVRSKQVPLAQKAVQQLFQRSALSAERDPWGATADWDLLYVGHCGDYFNSFDDGIGIGYQIPEDLEALSHIVFEDKTLPQNFDLHPFTENFLAAVRVPHQHRVVHQSKWPLCSFGYAVNRASAEKILSTVAPPKEIPERHISAFDVALLAACRDGPQLNCYTVNPELFHHMAGDSIIALEEMNERKIYLPPVDAEAVNQTARRHETSNIDCGFFSGHFYYDGDQEKLAYLREEVGRKGRCLKPWRSSWWWWW